MNVLRLYYVRINYFIKNMLRKEFIKCFQQLLVTTNY